MNTFEPQAPHLTHTRPARPSTYRGTLFAWALLSGLLALLVLLVVLIAAPTDLVAALRGAMQDPATLPPREIALLALAAAVPLTAAIAGSIIAAQSIRLFRLWLYLGRLHAYVGRQLRTTATLYQRGLLPRVQQVTSEGEPSGDDHPLQHLLSVRAPVLLTGEAGSGKTITLLSLTHELTRRGALLPLFFGRRRLPVLVPLAGFAESLDGGPASQLAYMQAQVARYGSPGLASRLPRLVRSGRVLLLCDSLSDTPSSAHRRILEELAVLPRGGRGPSVILAHTGSVGERAPDHVTQEWQHWRMEPLAADEVLRRVQASLPRGSARRDVRRLREELVAHRLDRALRLPGLLALATRHGSAEDIPLPYGRAALLQQELEAACARAASVQGVSELLSGEALSADTLRHTLAALASALAHADARAIPLPIGAHLGTAVTAWLAQHRPYSPLQSAASGPLAQSTEVLHACCIAAVRAGLLAITSDDGGVGFTHALLQAGFAADWLRAADDGVSPLDPGLLRRRWVLSVVLWTATAPDPGTITRRLLPLLGHVGGTYGPAYTPTPSSAGDNEPGAPRGARHTLARGAAISQPRSLGPAGAALALAGITAALAPRVSALLSASGAGGASGAVTDQMAQHEMARFERRLREVLDAVLELVTDEQDPAPLIRSLRFVESIVGDELAADIVYLASVPDFSRLARAQLTTTLGPLASPLAVAGLVEHLADKDPTLRTAVARGFALAGSRGVVALQGQLTSANEWVRARARESLDAISAMQLASRETAQVRAVNVLATAGPVARAAAAETLGALQAYDAVDALAARLADSEPQVRLAALRALGKLADPTVLPLLREQVKHPDPLFRAALAETLGAYRDPMLIPELSVLLDDGESAVRAAAATALGMLGDARAVEPLLAHFADADPRVSAAISSALRRLGQLSESGALRRATAPDLTGTPLFQADAS